MAMWGTAVGYVAALSLGLGILNEATLGHLISGAAKNLTAVALEADYIEFDAVKKVKKFLDDPDAFVCAAAAAAPAAPTGGGGGATAAAAAAPAAPEPEEEEEDMGFDLFD